MCVRVYVCVRVCVCVCVIENLFDYLDPVAKSEWCSKSWIDEESVCVCVYVCVCVCVHVLCTCISMQLIIASHFPRTTHS